MPSSSGIITSLTTRSGGSASACSSAARPSEASRDVVALAEQPPHVLAHVGVVVGHEHPARRTAGVRLRVARRARRSAASSPPGSQRSASATNGCAAGETAMSPAAGARWSAGRWRGAHRDADDEASCPRRACSRAVTVPPCSATSSRDQRQADAAALAGARPGALDAVEALEQPGQLVRRDAGAGVGHGELGRAAGRRAARR